MARVLTLGIVSDIHYASAAEQARGDDYELNAVSNPTTRLFLRAYRHFIWLRHPLRHNHLLDTFLARIGSPDLVIANGDYSCDSAFVGVSDDAACQSARECLANLRQRFGTKLRATIGDHELGKFSFVGKRGGLRLASFHRARSELNLEPFWRMELGQCVLIGVTSSLIALPVFESETLPEERSGWHELREDHLSQIRTAFSGLKPNQRVLLFCHDPTALPFLAREESISARFSQIEQTVIGHLHTGLILWKSRWLAGMPRISCLGHSVQRMSSALQQARHWKPFKVRLCPSLAGVELLKDGGFLTAELSSNGTEQPVLFKRHRIPR